MSSTLDQLRATYAAGKVPPTQVAVDEPDLRWKGLPGLIPLLVPVDTIGPHPRNPRRGNLNVLARSLEVFGQTKPVVVQASTRHIVAGNHTRRSAAEMLGWTHLAAVIADLDDDDAVSYLLMDNRSSDLGEYDTTGLVELLEAQAEAGRLAMAGYSGDDLDDLLVANERMAREALEASGSGGQIQPERNRDPNAEQFTEIVLLYTEERHRDVAKWLSICSREWSIQSASETIAEALRRAAENP